MLPKKLYDLLRYFFETQCVPAPSFAPARHRATDTSCLMYVGFSSTCVIHGACNGSKVDVCNFEVEFLWCRVRIRKAVFWSRGAKIVFFLNVRFFTSFGRLPLRAALS